MKRVAGFRRELVLLEVMGVLAGVGALGTVCRGAGREGEIDATKAGAVGEMAARVVETRLVPGNVKSLFLATDSAGKEAWVLKDEEVVKRMPLEDRILMDVWEGGFMTWENFKERGEVRAYDRAGERKGGVVMDTRLVVPLLWLGDRVLAVARGRIRDPEGNLPYDLVITDGRDKPVNLAKDRELGGARRLGADRILVRSGPKLTVGWGPAEKFTEVFDKEGKLIWSGENALSITDSADGKYLYFRYYKDGQPAETRGELVEIETGKKQAFPTAGGHAYIDTETRKLLTWGQGAPLRCVDFDGTPRWALRHRLDSAMVLGTFNAEKETQVVMLGEGEEGQQLWYVTLAEGKPVGKVIVKKKGAKYDYLVVESQYEQVDGRTVRFSLTKTIFRVELMKETK